MTCPYGHANDVGQRFCGVCGEALAVPPRSVTRAFLRAVGPYLRVLAGMFAAITLWLSFVALINTNYDQVLVQLIFATGLGYLAVGQPIRDRLPRRRAERTALAARADAAHAAFLAGNAEALAAAPPDLPPKVKMRRGVLIAAIIAAALVVLSIIIDISDGLNYYS